MLQIVYIICLLLIVNTSDGHACPLARKSSPVFLCQTTQSSTSTHGSLPLSFRLRRRRRAFLTVKSVSFATSASSPHRTSIQMPSYKVTVDSLQALTPANAVESYPTKICYTHTHNRKPDKQHVLACTRAHQGRRRNSTPNWRLATTAEQNLRHRRRARAQVTNIARNEHIHTK